MIDLIQQKFEESGLVGLILDSVNPPLFEEVLSRDRSLTSPLS